MLYDKKILKIITTTYKSCIKLTTMYLSSLDKSNKTTYFQKTDQIKQQQLEQLHSEDTPTRSSLIGCVNIKWIQQVL